MCLHYIVGERLRNLDILLGITGDNFVLCAHYDGPAVNGEHLVFPCNVQVSARFVKLMIREQTYLHVSEVKVYA